MARTRSVTLFPHGALFVNLQYFITFEICVSEVCVCVRGGGCKDPDEGNKVGGQSN